MESMGKPTIFGRATKTVRRFLLDCRGMAASEFALLLPLMLTFVIGTVEIGSALILDRKITSATQTAGDLVAQAETVTLADVNDIFLATEVILEPYDSAAAGSALYSVVMAADSSLSIDWSETHGASPPTPTTAIPAGLLQPGDSIIVAETNYQYQPIFAGLLFSPFNISDKAYLRPRRSSTVARN